MYTKFQRFIIFFVAFLSISNGVSAALLSGAKINLIPRPTLVKGAEVYEQGKKYNSHDITGHFAEDLLPINPVTSGDFLALMIWGDENSVTHFTFDAIAVSRPENDIIDVNIDLTVDPIVLPALNKYAYFIDIGPLPAAEYGLTVNHLITTLTDRSTLQLNTRFAVVPLPSTLLLFFSGALFLLRRTSSGR